jgi:HAE1 family hydrophobic/amphiphilic exporter-1
MVPLSEFVTLKRQVGPQFINHYNLFRSIEVDSFTPRGFSSGQVIAGIGEAFRTANFQRFGFGLLGLAREEVAAGGLAPLIFAVGIVVVFLTLAAQYESYVDPLIILLTVPLAILGALLLLAARGLPVDIYAQVGMVMLIGLSSKNAILIVDYANQALTEGKSISQAALEAARQRFRPIIMTAMSSLIGFFPLVIATGAGAPGRWSLGSVVFGGLLAATALSLLVVPILYVILKTLTGRLFSPRQAT